MNSIDYNIYIQDTLSLARTMVVKSAAFADVVNQAVAGANYSYDPLDPTTWKYYMHIAGIYHPTDKPMTVKSSDTGEVIPFTVDALKDHLATKRDYRHGTEEYQTLVAKYPNQVDLIKGVLNPVPIQTAIDAPDHTILYYNPDLVLWNEEPLIPKLQKWIMGYWYEWDHNNYNQTDNLMAHYLFGVMMEFIPGVVLGIRIEHIGTRFAHDFHIWSKLSSYGDLEKYKPYMSRALTMWCYRNIVWVQHNNGKQYTMDVLIEKILSDRVIPIGGYNINTSTATLPDSDTVDVLFQRRQLNLPAQYGDLRATRTTDTILRDEFTLARDNEDNYLEHLANTNEAVQTSLATNMPTKILESEMVDKTNSGPYSRMSVLVNEWAYLSTKKLYRAIVKIDNPKNGIKMTMSVADAFRLFIYAVFQTERVELAQMPDFWYFDVRRLTQPSRATLRAAGSVKYIQDIYLDEALANPIVFPSIISTEAFYNKCDEVFRGLWQHRRLYSAHSHYEARAHLKNMTRRFYTSGSLTLTNGMSYAEWFEKQGWSLSDITPEDWADFAYNLFSEATGWVTENNLTMQQIQRNMIDMMMDLSSYTVQTIVKINDGDVTDIDGNKISIGDVDYVPAYQRNIYDLPIKVLNADTALRLEVDTGAIPPSIDEVNLHSDFQAITVEHIHPVYSRHELHRTTDIALRVWVKDQDEGADLGVQIYPDASGRWVTQFGEERQSLTTAEINAILQSTYS